MPVVRAKALGWNESLTPEQELNLEPFQGQIDLEGELEVWEASDRTIYTVGGFEADPDTIEEIEELSEQTELTVSERARVSLKAQLADRVELAKRNLSPARFLIRWYNAGGNGIIRWGTDGDWTRCFNKASQYLDSEDAKGFCANRHHDALGYWPGECGKPGNKPCAEK